MHSKVLKLYFNAYAALFAKPANKSQEMCQERCRKHAYPFLQPYRARYFSLLIFYNSKEHRFLASITKWTITVGLWIASQDM
jgi:hypothetical protein